MSTLIPLVELARRFDCNRCTIRNWAKNNGVDLEQVPATNGKQALAMNESDAVRFHQHWLQVTTLPDGHTTVPALARECKVDRKTIRLWAEQNNKTLGSVRQSNSPPVQTIQKADAEAFKSEYSLSSKDAVPVTELLQEFNMDWRTVRKWIDREKCHTLKLREGNRHKVALSHADAQRCKAYLESLRIGYFYVAQLIPKHNPNRIKLGFAKNPEKRMLCHKVTCPETKLLATWKCRREDEKNAIRYITQKECVQVGEEVFDFDRFNSAVELADKFFGGLND